MAADHTAESRPGRTAAPMDHVVPIKSEALRTACSGCNLRELCLPIALTEDELDDLDALVALRMHVKRGETLFRVHDAFDAIYAVRAGFFKSRITSDDGRDQVIGFHMAGELLGLDGIGDGKHACDAIALEDSHVCVIPFERLETLSRQHLGLQRQFHVLMSRELVRDHDVMLLLGSMQAEARVTAFLLNLIQRLRARGYSGSSLILRMTREEIGSYLGLKIETVSRTFSTLQRDGVLAVHRRDVEILDEGDLRRRVSRSTC